MNGQRLRLMGLMPAQIAEALALKPFQGRQIFQWIHQKGVFDFDAMTNLSKPMRERLKAECTVQDMRVVSVQVSEGSSATKILFELEDGERVESVLLRDGGRVTLCLSSQAGCPLNCSFCATGMAGFRRNLDAGEIAGQALLLLSAGEVPRELTPNVVYMGMGEPFLNYEHMVESIRLLMHPEGLNVGARHITVSTVGVVEGVSRFAAEDWQVRLSISLHAANDELRSKLVPHNRSNGLRQLRDALRDYGAKTGRQVTVEWTLLDDVNDGPGDVRELLAFLKGLKVFVNLIPWNPVPGLPFNASSRAKCVAFQEGLEQGGVKATLRRENGGDIAAACGQLRAMHEPAELE
jgi:23S rRNA (adenine2503-C2)-methyltransferase